MKKHFVAAAALVTVLTLGACSNKEEVSIPLTNGKEDFITSDVYNVSKQEVFNKMVNEGGIVALLDTVDYDVLSTKYEIDETQIDSAIDTYKTIYPDFDSFLQVQGFNSEEDLREYLALNLYRQEAVRSAVVVTDEEIQARYDETYKKEETATEEGTTEEATTDETETTEVPAFDDVKDSIKETLTQEKMTSEFIVATLAAEREAAGFVIYNDFLEQQYMQISSTYTEDTTKSDLIAKTDTKEYTADELYNELVTSYGLSNGISIIDTKILEKKFSVDDKAIKEMIDEFKVKLGTNYYAYMQQYGLTNDQEIYDYFKLAQLQDAAFSAEYPITDEQLQAAYEAYKPEISARHILVADEETAKDLIAQLDAAEDKEAKFQELAKEFSSDSSASNGGDLGSFGTGKMVAEFENAAFALNVGEYSKEPVKTQYGYHIIYKYDEAEKPSFEDLKEELETTLRTEEYTQLRLESILIKYREEVNFKFTDEALQARYETIINNIKESAAKEEGTVTETKEQPTDENTSTNETPADETGGQSAE